MGDRGRNGRGFSGERWLPRFGVYETKKVPAGGGDNLMVLTIYQSLMTASLDAFGEHGKNTVRCLTSYVYWRRLSIALAQHPAKRETRSISI
ncbi:MAG: hypothetical protein Fur0025_17230 [Oscillatoriaceae cyanobacterium]